MTDVFFVLESSCFYLLTEVLLTLCKILIAILAPAVGRVDNTIQYIDRSLSG